MSGTGNQYNNNQSQCKSVLRFISIQKKIKILQNVCIKPAAVIEKKNIRSRHGPNTVSHIPIAISRCEQQVSASDGHFRAKESQKLQHPLSIPERNKFSSGKLQYKNMLVQQSQCQSVVRLIPRPKKINVLQNICIKPADVTVKVDVKSGEMRTNGKPLTVYTDLQKTGLEQEFTEDRAISTAVERQIWNHYPQNVLRRQN